VCLLQPFQSVFQGADFNIHHEKQVAHPALPSKPFAESGLQYQDILLAAGPHARVIARRLTTHGGAAFAGLPGQATPLC
jgi:hypothetical protein